MQPLLRLKYVVRRDMRDREPRAAWTLTPIGATASGVARPISDTKVHVGVDEGSGLIRQAVLTPAKVRVASKVDVTEDSWF